MDESVSKKENFFKRLFSKKDDYTEEEIIEMVNSQHESGAINANEAAMIQNIFEFGDKDAKDIMVHRANIVALESHMTLRNVISVINDESFSRYPVYSEDIDNIIGLIHIKDILKLASSSKYTDTPICEIEGVIRPVEFIPETHGINSVFAKMQSEKNHMVIVVDEYGQTSGILSMEDILEEIVGEIEDEHDDEEEGIEVVNQNHFKMDGLCEIEEVEETLDIKIDGDFETLNGFLINEYGKIPEDGSSFVVFACGCEFRVIKVVNRTINEVWVRKLATNV